MSCELISNRRPKRSNRIPNSPTSVSISIIYLPRATRLLLSSKRPCVYNFDADPPLKNISWLTSATKNNVSRWRRPFYLGRCPHWSNANEEFHHQPAVWTVSWTTETLQTDDERTDPHRAHELNEQTLDWWDTHTNLESTHTHPHSHTPKEVL